MKTTTIRHALTVVLFVAGLLAARPAAAGSLTLQWDFNPEPDVTGYIVYVGTSSGSYSQSFDVGNVNTFVFDTGVTGQRYFFAVAAYAGLLVSDLSVEVTGEATATSNGVPYIFSPGNQTSTVGVPVSLQIVAGDPAFEPLTYSARGLPSGLRIASSTGLISGTPTTASGYNVVVTVTDGVLSSQAAFSWMVMTPGGTPPAPAPDGTLSGGAIPRDEETTRALRSSESSQTGSAALLRPPTGTPPPPQSYTGTAALIRTTTGPGTVTTASAPRTYTGSAALTREETTTTGGATPLANRTYTGTAAVIRSAVDPALDPLSYTGTSAMVRRRDETTSATGTLATPSRTSSARALATSSSTDGTAAMTRSGAPSTVTASTSSPVVSIQTPVDQASFAAGTEVVFSAIARDPEDGDVSSRIIWFSSLDGQIGTGGTMSRVLSTGTHMITAMATDTSGNMRSSRVSIIVR